MQSKKTGTEIGERISSLRKKMGLSQEELAERANIHFTYIGQIERAEKIPSLKSLLRIAEAMNVSLDYFLISKNKKQDATIIELVNVVSAMNKEEKELLLDIAKSILKRKICK